MCPYHPVVSTSWVTVAIKINRWTQQLLYKSRVFLCCSFQFLQFSFETHHILGISSVKMSKLQTWFFLKKFSKILYIVKMNKLQTLSFVKILQNYVHCT